MIKEQDAVVKIMELCNVKNLIEYSRFLYLNTTIYLLVDRSNKAKEYHFLDQHASGKYQFLPNQTLFCYSLSSITNSHPLNVYYYRVNPVFLIGGIKLNQVNFFLSEFGPIIDYTDEFTV